MTPARNSIFKAMLSISTVGSLVTLLYLLVIPRDAKNAWIWGFSRNRAVLILGFALISVVLILLTVSIFRQTRRTQKLIGIISGWLATPKISWVALIFFVLLLVLDGVILFQWNFVATDQQLAAYLQRLTPLLLFGGLICIQVLFLLWFCYFSSDRRQRWLFGLAVTGSWILFQWLLVGEFYLADQFFPEYYVAERYGESLRNWLPYILFQTTLFIQLPYLLREQLNLTIDTRWPFLALALVLGYFYADAALTHAREANLDLSFGDQDVYVDFIRQIVQSDFTYTGTRNQTPGYPYLQAFFCHTDLTDLALFECGKRMNIVFSIILLVLLFLIFRKFLTFHPAFTLLLINAFFVFVFKAPYLKAELVYYFASFFCFLLMCRMLIRPSIKLGIVTGIAFGLTHLLKASVLPGICLFVGVFILREIWRWRKSSSFDDHQISTKRHFASLGMSLLFFVVIIFPYIRESQQIYGGYFYNVNTSYYIWYDSWEEAKQMGIKHNFESGQPDLPQDQRPGLQKYLSEHSIYQIFERFWVGLRKQATYFWKQYGVFNYLALYLGVFALFLIVNFRTAKQLIKKYIHLWGFALLYVLGYTALFAWYDPIAGGPRFMTGLFLPLLFSTFIVIKALTNGKVIEISGHKIALTNLFEGVNTIVIALLVFDAFMIITQIFPAGYFGS